MELFEVLNNYCNRNSGAVSNDDKRRHSYMLRRLFSAQYPLQCELVNRLDTDPIVSSQIVALLASRYNGLPAFLSTRVEQKKKKESLRKFFEDDVINRYLEINECGIRELMEAYEFYPDEVTKTLKIIKSTFFDNKDKTIISKSKYIDEENGSIFD